jgi:hypothetical protein
VGTSGGARLVNVIDAVVLRRLLVVAGMAIAIASCITQSQEIRRSAAPSTT